MNEMISQEFAWDYKKIRQLFLSNDVQKLNLASDLNKLPTAKFFAQLHFFDKWMVHAITCQRQSYFLSIVSLIKSPFYQRKIPATFIINLK